MYSKKVLEEFYNPENVGVIKGADSVGKVKDRTCGDIIKIYISVKNNTITDAMFQAYGNTVSIAASSIATKLIKNRTIDEAYAITSDTLNTELGSVPANRKYSLLLVEEAIKGAIVSYFQKTMGKVPEKYLTGTIKNSDSIDAGEEEKEEEKPEKSAKKAEKPAKKEEKQPKKEVKKSPNKPVINDDDLDEDDLDLDDDDDLDDEVVETNIIETEQNKPAEQTNSSTITTKTVNKSIEVFTRDGDSEEDDIYGSIDNLTSTIGEALKKLNEEDKK
ncbi:MAG: iron-sulfur cluster assembly scaffold protein [Clostridia bacterium]|nr:iron-sulfur cluster assembly scaffold protein [Clostridia bacterium]